MPKKLTLDEFIKRSAVVHENSYDYSESEYLSGSSKIKILCKTHGAFMQIAWNHINGAGCPECAGLIKKTTEKFIKESNKVHKYRYDYSKTNYIRIRDKVEIKCLTHGTFFQEPFIHLKGSGCPKCAHSFQSDTQSFIDKAREIHNDLYNYEKTKYIQSKEKVIITCKKHGDFFQSPNNHLKGTGCPRCRRSKGEILIQQYLDKNSIKYIEQHKIDGCKNKRRLSFDFFLPDFNVCIEFDGLQHFKSSDFFGGNKRLLDVIRNDEIKNDFCKNAGLELIRINDFNVYLLDSMLEKFILYDI
jgi:very-short-patch-repair endonuclease